GMDHVFPDPVTLLPELAVTPISKKKRGPSLFLSCSYARAHLGSGGVGGGPGAAVLLGRIRSHALAGLEARAHFGGDARHEAELHFALLEFSIVVLHVHR